MFFCSKPNNITLLIIVIASFFKPNKSEICCTPNVRTVLFSTDDLDLDTCWTPDNVALLLSRYLLQSILPKYLPKDIDSLSTFIDICFGEVNSLVGNNHAHRLMVKSVADTLGGYQQGYGLPITYQLFYESNNAPLMKVLKILSEQQEMQKILGTNGASWVEPLVVHDTYTQVQDFKIECSTSIDYCNKIELIQDDFTTSKHKKIPLPVVDDVDKPRALALPLKETKLHSLFSCSSENVLHAYYETAMCCLRGGCEDDIEYFQGKFNMWLKRFVVCHLNDGTFYPAYKGVFTILKSVNNKNIHFEIVKGKNNSIFKRFKKVITSKRSLKIMKNVCIGVAALVIVTAVYPGVKYLVLKLYEKWRSGREGKEEERKDEKRNDVEKGGRLVGSKDSREMYEHVKKINEELRRMDQRRGTGADGVSSLAAELRASSHFDLFKTSADSKPAKNLSKLFNPKKKSVADKPKSRNSNLETRGKSESSAGTLGPRSSHSNNPRKKSNLRSEAGKNSVSNINYIKTKSPSEPSVKADEEKLLNPAKTLSNQDIGNKYVNSDSNPSSTAEKSKPSSRKSSSNNPRRVSVGSRLGEKDSLDLYDEMRQRMTNRSQNMEPSKRFSSLLEQRLSGINLRKRSADSKLDHKDSLEMYDEMKNRMMEMLKAIEKDDSRKSSVDRKYSERDSSEIFDELKRRMTELSKQKRRRTTMGSSTIEPTNSSRNDSIDRRNSSRNDSILRTSSPGSKRVSVLDPEDRRSRKVSIFDELHKDDHVDNDDDDDESPDYRWMGDSEETLPRLKPSTSEKSLQNYKSFDDDDDDNKSTVHDDDENPYKRTVDDSDDDSNKNNSSTPTTSSSGNTLKTAIRVNNNRNNVDDREQSNKEPSDKDETNKTGYFY